VVQVETGAQLATTRSFLSMAALPKTIINNVPAKRGRRVPASSRPAARTTRRKRSLALKQELMFLADKFPQSEYADMFTAALNFVSQLAGTTREGDRDRVLHAIEQLEAHTVSEIMEDTHLPDWLVRVILQEMVDVGLLNARRQHDPAASAGSSTTFLYFLSHTPAGSDFIMPGKSTHISDDDSE
jgi:hypothetical protein